MASLRTPSKLKDFGRAAGGADIHQSIGYNFKFTDLQACVGIEQMKKLDWRIKRKKDILVKYRQALCAVGSVKFFEQDLVNTTPWFIDILCERRADLQEHLNKGESVPGPCILQSTSSKHISVSESIRSLSSSGSRAYGCPPRLNSRIEQIETVCDSVAEFYS
jgi:perosamine synthetase